MGKRITAVLQDHDAVLTWLARRMEAANETDRQFIEREFVQCLGTHILAIENVLKPVLQHCGVADRLADWFSAVESLKNQLADALTLQQHSTQFRSALKRISVQLEDLREQEGERLASMLTECLSDGELQLLGADVRLFLSHRVDTGKP